MMKRIVLRSLGEIPSPAAPTVDGAIADLARRFEAAGVDSPRREAQLLVEYVTGMDRAQLAVHPDRILSDTDAKTLAGLGRRRAAREPLAYLVGRREFWSLDFAVTADTLIPRPDSETLVEAALDSLADRRAPLRLLDLGTGSGCLLLALLSELPEASGVGVDIRSGACAVAQANARALGLASRSDFVVGNWADALDGRFDLVAVNPPYVPSDEAAMLEPEIVRYEPANAVFATGDGLDAYRAVLPQLARLLHADGSAVIEIGAGQAESVGAIAAANRLAIAGERADLTGQPRCLSLRVSAFP